MKNKHMLLFTLLLLGAHTASSISAFADEMQQSSTEPERTDRQFKTDSVIQTGTWNDVTWEFDSITGELIFTSSGTLGNEYTSPWNQAIDPVKSSDIKKIIFQQPATAPENSNYLFSSSDSNKTLSNLNSIEGIDKLDVSNVRYFNSAFYNCTQLDYLDLTSFNMSNVCDISMMFGFCSSLKHLNVSNWDMSNVVSIDSAFFLCSSLTSIDVSNWDVSNISSMQALFQGCSSLTELNLSHWNTSKAVPIHSMFDYCSSLVKLDISSFSTASIDYDTALVLLFSGCFNLQEIKLGSEFSSVGQVAIELPAIDTSSGVFTGRWVQVTNSNPTIYNSSDEFMANYNGSAPGTYVWQRYPTIKASDYTMYVGDPNPTKESFQVMATNQYGNSDEVVVDLSKADLTKAGEYTVTITSTDGQCITVKLTVLDSPVKTGTVTTKYVNQYGDEIATSQTQTATLGAPYTTKAIDIEGYELDENQLPKNATGSYTLDPITVTYIYNKKTVPNTGGSIDPSRTIESNSISSQAQKLPNTGEHTSWLINIAGASILACNAYFITKAKKG